MKVYTFWRSIASYRVRMAMNLKGLNPDVEFVDLLKGEQHGAAYASVNPQKLIPAVVLDDGGPPLFQSMAIMEWLEETYPNPPLLPRDARGRARVRGLAQIVVSDAHPLSVPRIRNYLTKDLKLGEEQMLAWVRHWQNEALRTLETLLARDKDTGRFCHGDQITIADICLCGQAAGSSFFQVDMSPYPTVSRIVAEANRNEAIARAHPLKQPGAPASI
ncbi:MAG TPA: maleylacetoacetate isomerase [Xanthobacteraceae bacterium]|nr:maleylacetoacetate isomerase [Xanthobacteraceae bacterium]